MYQAEYCLTINELSKSMDIDDVIYYVKRIHKNEFGLDVFLDEFLDFFKPRKMRRSTQLDFQYMVGKIQERCNLLVPLEDSEVVELASNIARLIAEKGISKNRFVPKEFTDNKQITGKEFIENLMGDLPFLQNRSPIFAYRRVDGRMERFMAVAKLLISSLLEDDQDNLDTIWRSLLLELNKATNAISEQKKYDSTDLEIIEFYYRVMAFFEYIDGRFDDCWDKVALSEIIQLLCPRLESMELSDKTAIRVAKNLLNQDASLKVVQAFMCLARIAYGKGELQLAYDTLYSWLMRRSVGIIKDENLFFVANKQGIFNDQVLAEMEMSVLRPFSDVCIAIGDAYGAKEGCEVFIELAKDKLGVYKDKMCIHYNQLLVQQAKRMIILGEYEAAKDILNEVIQNVDAFVQASEDISVSIVKFYLLSSRMKAVSLFLMLRQKKGEGVDYDVLATEDEVNKLRSNVSGFLRNPKIHSNIQRVWKTPEDDLQWMFLLENVGKGNQEVYDIYWLIDSLSGFIIRALRRHEYEMPRFFTRDEALDKRLMDGNVSDESIVIAYYTTLNNFMFLFDELKPDKEGKPKIVDDGESGINCFTVMHENYMNDPYEGVALIGAMKAEKVFPAKQLSLYRERLLQKQHVFLKSFTDETDKLHMWNRYASDYDSDGKSSNGCCVIINPKTFQRVVLSNKKLGSFDDYNLYRVLYVTKNGKLIFSNMGDMEIRIHYMFESLKMLFATLDAKISKYRYKERIMQQIIDTSFGRLMFLVKDGAYEDEHESRIIIRRGLSDADIRTLDKVKPAKLALNPFFQVYVKKVVLGPNVKYKDEWKPILRKKLSTMWKKQDGLNKNSDVSAMFDIADSEIPYTSK